MSAAPYPIDTSAAARLLISDDHHDRWGEALTRGLIALCDLTELELLCSARSRPDREANQNRLRRLFSWAPVPDGTLQRAREVQELLTDHGEHRSAGPVDLMVAAVAGLTDMTLLHYDRDFETIARRTQQPTCWLADPGSAK
ncbi:MULTISPECIES: PIN domain nuclease [Streptomyces]|uniref:Ribonuclease VapC n=2 Tax=Streptomyces TaxID=1883 RepID=A0A3R7IRC8_9ACTN|nr:MULTISPECIES: PIN domain nuclease [Streptomyces]KNE80713.1 twitching motility protein PilT [Streptomyces fradiae]OFA43906.1 twitching motility protein PilT [Streptomyces fradiae]PQM21456.1 PIN domain nuclease [Streptomyces xinghaiensis]RKM94484.1 PIN domain nuclease [Streptomyces xinghaiensis]RNC72083.1 PIN domain nuclease [Streptomyces xinghaiensis]